MMQEIATCGHLVFRCSTLPSTGVQRKRRGGRLAIRYTEFCRYAVASMYIAVAKWCNSKSTDETVDLNENIDISQKLITNSSKRETSDSFDPASRKPPTGRVRAK